MSFAFLGKRGEVQNLWIGTTHPHKCHEYSERGSILVFGKRVAENFVWLNFFSCLDYFWNNIGCYSVLAGQLLTDGQRKLNSKCFKTQTLNTVRILIK